MFRISTFQKIFVGALLAVVMAGGDALAQRGEGRGRGGGGGGDGGSRSSSSRSFSGGGGGGGGSSRSFSGGGGSSRSSRSFSGGGESSRSSRSFSSSPRSSGIESGSSFRSSSGDSRSSRQLSRPSDSGSSRSFSDQSRSGQVRSFDGGQRNAERSVIGQSDRGTFSGQQGDRTARSFDRGSQGRSGQQQYEARRPNASEGEVRDFLGLPSDGSSRQARSGDRSGQFRSSDDSQRRADVARRLEGASRNGDRVRDGENVFGRTGDRDGRDGDRSRDISRDRDFDRNRDFDRERDFNRNGDRDFARRDGKRGRDGRDGDRDRDWDGRSGDRDRDYASWRGGADRDHDNRDWSGRWRDGDRFDDARRIRKDWRDRDWGDWNKYPFYAGWWGGHHRWHGGHGHDWNWWGSYARRYNNPFYWWAWTTAPRLTSWVNFGWNRPYYWDYGPGEYIYCDDGIVYVNGRWYQPAPVFYDRTVQIVERAPDLTPAEAAELEWLPLGVFAVTPDGEAQANVLVQLAVTKDGVISGTAFDQKGGSASPIEGTVDRETQRAVWSYNNSENKRIVMETSVYNLTQPEATGLVHYGPDDFRVVELVRLEEPNATSGTTSATGELPAP